MIWFHFLNRDASVIGEFFEKWELMLMMHVRRLAVSFLSLGTLITIIVDLLGKGLKRVGRFLYLVY